MQPDDTEDQCMYNQFLVVCDLLASENRESITLMELEMWVSYIFEKGMYRTLYPEARKVYLAFCEIADSVRIFTIHPST